ncbi:hypothetical protein TNCV_1936781 [Trichonephila clavipes]|nr:hypothetical protein TNCV_1936781 [Trichonephila clavipes]
MKLVHDGVVKLVNTIRSRELTHGQFRDFQSVQSEYSDVLYYSKNFQLAFACHGHNSAVPHCGMRAVDWPPPV